VSLACTVLIYNTAVWRTDR